jgi:hypothetical protein
MLYLLNLFKEKREIKLANEKREEIRNFMTWFTRQVYFKNIMITEFLILKTFQNKL